MSSSRDTTQPVAALRLPLEVDLAAFIDFLRRLQVPHQVTEEAGEQVLWAVDATTAAQVRQLYERAPRGDDSPELAALASEVTSASQRPSAMAQLRASPMTALVLLACLIVGVITLLGDNRGVVSWFTFLDFTEDANYAYFTPLSESLAHGQIWRLFSPMLLHFGVLHIAMNGLWYWEFGRRIEARHNAFCLLGLTLLFSVVSNFAQYWFSGPSLFGGLSGVLYGLLGYCWIFQWLAPNPLYRLPRGTLVMMLVWLVVCLSGVISLAGFGLIANAAHVGGLAIGCLSGLVGGALARRSR